MPLRPLYSHKVSDNSSLCLPKDVKNDICGKLNCGNLKKKKELFTRGWLSARKFVRVVSRNSPPPPSHSNIGPHVLCIIYKGCTVEPAYSNHPQANKI